MRLGKIVLELQTKVPGRGHAGSETASGRPIVSMSRYNQVSRVRWFVADELNRILTDLKRSIGPAEARADDKQLLGI